MYLSRLTLNVRLPTVRRDLADPYEMHRTLWRAFPKGDPGRILFRVESVDRGGRVEVLVQSDLEPDWSRVPEGYFTGKEHKKIQPAFLQGQRLRFRLRVNPTKRVHSRNEKLGTTMAGKRVGVRGEAALLEWLSRKGSEGGFRLGGSELGTAVRVREEGRMANGKPGFGGAFDSVVFEGILEVTDPEKFLQCLGNGIGTAKGYGFGLLTVALLASVA